VRNDTRLGQFNEQIRQSGASRGRLANPPAFTHYPTGFSPLGDS
jgi:hypothetical protein